MNCGKRSISVLTDNVMLFVMISFSLATSLCAQTGGQTARGDVWEDGDWTVSTAECMAIDISQKEARQRALYDARKKAIEFEVGIHISSADILVNSTSRSPLFQSLLNIASNGLIIDERPHQWQEIEIGNGRNGLTQFLYRVTLTCKVSSESGKKDPDFNIEFILNKDMYKSLDLIEFSAYATKDSYLTIFVVYEDNEKVTIIYPNEYETGNKLTAGKEIDIPGNNSYEIKAFCPENIEESLETVIALFTKNQVDFSFGLEKEGIYHYLPTPITALNAIMEKLITIQISDREMTFRPIRIVK
ncbi:hypothetical protein ES708_05978 [subsurface metagenome]